MKPEDDYKDDYQPPTYLTCWGCMTSAFILCADSLIRQAGTAPVGALALLRCPRCTHVLLPYSHVLAKLQGMRWPAAMPLTHPAMPSSAWHQPGLPLCPPCCCSLDFSLPAELHIQGWASQVPGLRWLSAAASCINVGSDVGRLSQLRTLKLSTPYAEDATDDTIIFEEGSIPGEYPAFPPPAGWALYRPACSS